MVVRAHFSARVRSFQTCPRRSPPSGSLWCTRYFPGGRCTGPPGSTPPRPWNLRSSTSVNTSFAGAALPEALTPPWPSCWNPLGVPWQGRPLAATQCLEVGRLAGRGRGIKGSTLCRARGSRISRTTLVAAPVSAAASPRGAPRRHLARAGRQIRPRHFRDTSETLPRHFLRGAAAHV